jgi:hypothetical protein
MLHFLTGRIIDVVFAFVSQTTSHVRENFDLPIFIFSSSHTSSVSRSTVSAIVKSRICCSYASEYRNYAFRSRSLGENQREGELGEPRYYGSVRFLTTVCLTHTMLLVRTHSQSVQVPVVYCCRRRDETKCEMYQCCHTFTSLAGTVMTKM